MQSTISQKLIKNAIGVIYLALISFVAVTSYKSGVSQYLASLPINSKSDSQLKQAFIFDSSNPQVYQKRGEFFLQKGNYKVASHSFKRAINLRSNDYFLWLLLGYSYDKSNDFDNAKNAYEQAVNLAPNYAAPQEFIGTLLLEQNYPEQAFVYLRRAASIDIYLLPKVLDFAHKVYLNDSELIERAIQPDTTDAKRKVASDFIAHNIMSDGMKRFLLSEELSKKAKDNFIKQLIEAKNYTLALDVWASKEKASLTDFYSGSNLILNGNFEDEINKNNKFFSWITSSSKDKNFDVFLSDENVFSGSKDLLIEFRGTSNPESAIIYQLLPVAPDKNYQLTFANRTQDLISGSLPLIKIIDADSNEILGRSAVFSEQSDKWRKGTIDFKTRNQTKAVIVSLQRLDCPSPCPIFGSLWLDDFILKVLKNRP